MPCPNGESCADCDSTEVPHENRIKSLFANSHYAWLDKHLEEFFTLIDLPNPQWNANGMGTAHGDKCYSYRISWSDAGLPFNHGVAIYMLSYCDPYSKTVRETESGWVAPDTWVIEMYQQFKTILCDIDTRAQKEQA